MPEVLRGWPPPSTTTKIGGPRGPQLFGANRIVVRSFVVIVERYEGYHYFEIVDYANDVRDRFAFMDEPRGPRYDARFYRHRWIADTTPDPVRIMAALTGE